MMEMWLVRVEIDRYSWVLMAVREVWHWKGNRVVCDSLLIAVHPPFCYLMEVISLWNVVAAVHDRSARIFGRERCTICSISTKRGERKSGPLRSNK